MNDARHWLSAAGFSSALVCAACGLDRSSPALGQLQSPILGGTEVPFGVWSEVSSHDCSGVLIAPRWVLSAAHCTAFNDAVQLNHRTESLRVVSTHTYPDWQSSLDLGLLELEATAQTAPARVAHGCASNRIEQGALIAIVGWGATRSYPAPQERFNSTLQQAFLSISDDVCADPADSCLVPGAEFQAGTPSVDTCSGDSGAPAYLLTWTGPLVAGITSRVADIDPALDQSCGLRPGIYVRPDAAIEWIESVMGEALPEPDCGMTF